jgi:hypothetical protein
VPAGQDVAASYGEHLAGKVVDICNPVDFSTFDSLVVPPGTSAAEQIAAAPGARVVNVETNRQETRCGGRAAVAAEPVRELLSGATVPLGGPRDGGDPLPAPPMPTTRLKPRGRQP